MNLHYLLCQIAEINQIGVYYLTGDTMLRDPCKLCLVKPNCSVTCDEKTKRELKLDNIKVPFLFVVVLSFTLVCFIYTLLLLSLTKINIISTKQYNHLNPFRNIAQWDIDDNFY